MLRNQWKRLLCLILVIAVISSLAVTALAADQIGGTYYPNPQVQEKIIDMIQRVLLHESSILKELVRVPFRIAATAGTVLGCTTAATLLRYSLLDDPKAPLDYDSASRFAAQLLNSVEFQNLLLSLEDEFGGSGVISKTGSLLLESTLDLYLAYHGIGYVASGTKEGDVWTITFTFTDIYDFHEMELGDTLSIQSLIAVMNNFAVFAQAIGAIVPYSITIEVQI